jgi:hypothetical protein
MGDIKYSSPDYINCFIDRADDGLSKRQKPNGFMNCSHRKKLATVCDQ